MDIKAKLKEIFLRPEPPRPITLEDLMEPEESPKEEEPIVPKQTLMDKLMRRKPILPYVEPKLSVRQRIKRYNASMEGKHGIPEDARKRG